MKTPAAARITGLVMAGGRGSRLGGVDKGLQPFEGQPLAWHALQRLAPQVGPLMLNANRHLETYAAWGVPVWPDELPGQPGPLAGLLTGLGHCRTPYLACVPCDAPRFPADLVARLAAALAAAEAELAMAETADGPQPVFCLLHTSLRPGLLAYLQAGRRRMQDWIAAQRSVRVRFDDAPAFFNANTPAELEQLRCSSKP